MQTQKNYLNKKKLIEPGKLYDFDEGVALLKKLASAKFNETVELHVRLGVDSRHADQQVRGAIVLPNGTGKTTRVLAFSKGAKAEEAKERAKEAARCAGEWFEKATEQGDVKARESLLKAAEQGNATAQNYLGWMYQEGRGVEQSNVAAAEWYRKAAEQGHVDTAEALRRLGK